MLPVLLLLCLIPERTAAQQPGDERRVTGTVTSEGQSVSGAVVEIRDLRGVKLAHVLTNRAGAFAVSVLATSGEYVVLADKGQELRDERVTLTRSDTEVRISLPSAPEYAVPAEQTVSVRRLGIPAETWKRLKAAHTDFIHGNLQEAKRQILRAMQLAPTCGQAFSMLAFVELAANDPGGALEDAKRSTLLDPADAESFVALAMSYDALKQFEKAAESARQALRLRPASWQARLELARSLLGQNQFILALRELELIDTDFPDVHMVRGNVLLHLDRKAEAAEEFETFLREAPSDLRKEQVQRLVASVREPAPCPPGQ